MKQLSIVFAGFVALAGLCPGCGGDGNGEGHADSGTTVDASVADPDAPGDVDAGVLPFPSYGEYDLLARSNFSVNPGGAYRVPADYFFSNEDVSLNDHGQVSFRLTVTPGGHKSVWLGDADGGSVVYDSAVDAFMMGTSLGDDGRVIFALDYVTTPGIYFYDAAASPSSGYLTNAPLGATGWGTPAVNREGQLGYRAAIGAGHALYSYAEGSEVMHVAETALDPESPYEYIFNPALNDRRELAAKVRLGPGIGEERPDEIRIFAADGTSLLVEQDADADAGSPFIGFDATRVGLNNSGQVAFVADLVSGGRGVFLSDGVSRLEIATEADAEISEIEFFGPDVNDHGLVVFRAFDAAGKRAIWVGDGVSLTRVITEHDVLPIDLGDARIDQEAPEVPVFGGAPRINAQGDVALNAGVAPPDDDQVEWGSAVLVARALR